jgi:E1-E2 ATPase
VTLWRRRVLKSSFELHQGQARIPHQGGQCFPDPLLVHRELCTQALADRAAAILFYVAVVSGATTLTYWWFSGDKEHALIRTATVLIIACPHALGLAIPLVIAISTSLGAQNGLLIKDRLALDQCRELGLTSSGVP